MRDGHIECSHQEARPQARLVPSNPDVDELQPLLFDLIRLDKVEAVKSIMFHFNKLDYSVQREMLDLVASSGSGLMARVLSNARVPNEGWLDWIDYCTTSIKNMNFETLRWFLPKIDEALEKETVIDFGNTKFFLAALTESGSLEIFRECEKHVIILLRQNSSISYDNTRICLDGSMIRATAGNLDREHILVSIWAALKMGNMNANTRKYVREALGRVARTTHSIFLAKTLLEYGADVNHPKGRSFLGPLHFASRHDSHQAAELMRFLLYNGADPETHSNHARLQIRDEKGPKNIARWIGISWDDLVKMVKLDRERGFCPPEYRSVFSSEFIFILEFGLIEF